MPKSKRSTRQHLNPVAHDRRLHYIEQRKRKMMALKSPQGVYMMRLLEERMAKYPHQAKVCARRLLSSFSYAELGLALYMKCRRVLAPPKDPIRAKVVPKGKPGAMSAAEKVEYENRAAVHRMREIVGAD